MITLLDDDDIKLMHDPIELLKELLCPVKPDRFRSAYEWKIDWEARARAAIANAKDKKETV